VRQGEQIIRFAEEEQLFAHAEAIKVRLKNQQAAQKP
jgi:histidinol dehydrogenase